MADPIAWKVQHASIVLVSTAPIDPQSISADVLSRNQIVPEDWHATNEMNTPVLGMTQYRNGAVLRAEGNRCIFQQTVNGGFQSEYDAHILAENYADASRVVPYRSIGINWLLEPDLDEPRRWLQRQLASGSGFAPGFQPISVKVAKRAGAATCNLTFNLQPGGAVHVDCNFHIDLGNRTAIEMMRMWPHFQENLTSDILPTIIR